MKSLVARPLRADVVWPVAVAGVTALFYFPLTATVIGFQDTAEFALTSSFLAPGHYPGYPFPVQLLYLANLVSSAPANWAAWLNAGFAVAAVTALYGCARVLGVRPLVAGVLALTFAFARPVWEAATGGPEAYCLEALTTALVVGLGLVAVARRDFRYYLVALLLFGLGLGNRTSFAAMAAWLVIVPILIPRRRWDIAFAVFALGVSVYMLMAIRWLYVTNWWFDTLVGRFKEMSDKTVHVPRDAVAARFDFKYLGTALAQRVGYPALALGVVGVAAPPWGRRDLIVKGALFAGLAGFLAVFTMFRGNIREPYLVVPFVFLFLFAGLGADKALAWLTGCRRCGFLWRATLWLLPAAMLVNNFHLADRRGDLGATSLLAEGTRYLRYRSAVVGEHGNFMPFAYNRMVLRVRPDVTYTCAQADDWLWAVGELQARGLPTFRARTEAPPSRRPSAVYVVSAFPGIYENADFRPVSLPEEFLSRHVASLPPGQCFVAAAGDLVVDLGKGPEITNRIRENPVAAKCSEEGVGYYWRRGDARVPLFSRDGSSTFFVGERTEDGVSFFAVVAWGNVKRNRFEKPAWSDFPLTGPVAFVSFGPEQARRTGIRIILGGRRYGARGGGILFIPVSPEGLAVGAPRRYYLGGSGAHAIFVARNIYASFFNVPAGSAEGGR